MEQTEEMKICAAKVAQCPCALCSRRAACEAKGGSVSNLARFLAKLTLKMLPHVANEMRLISTKELKLEAFTPTLDELYEGAYAVVRIYEQKRGNNKKLLARAYMTGEEDYAAVVNNVLRAYSESAAKERKQNHDK